MTTMTTSLLPRLLLTLVLVLLAPAALRAQEGLPPAAPVLDKALDQPAEWFKSDDGRKLADNIVTWQNPEGGWWKQYDPKIARPAHLPSPNTAGPGAKNDQEDAWRTSSTF